MDRREIGIHRRPEPDPWPAAYLLQARRRIRPPQLGWTSVETVTTPTVPSDPPPRLGRPWTVRVAAWSARHRWPVAGLWFVATIGLFVGSILAGGTRSVDAVSRDQQAQYESSEAYLVYGDANAAAGQETPATQQFLLLVSTPNGTVDDPAFQAALDDIVGRLKGVQSTVAGVNGPVFEQLLDPRTAPPQANLISPDQDDRGDRRAGAG